jgi:hypothetical protein
MASLATLTASLNKFSALSRGERRLLIEAFLLLPAVHLGLRFLGYSRLLRLIEAWMPLPVSAGVAAGQDRLMRARKIAQMVSIAASRGVYRATCLRRSLGLLWFLRRESIESRVHFGVRRSGGRLEAHAWVECNGTVINDAPDVHERYPRLQETLPATGMGL